MASYISRRGEGPWEPILRGADATRALEIVRDIADSLLSGESIQRSDPSLAGLAGHALTFSYLASYFKDQRYRDAADECHETALELLGKMATPASLYGGWVGTIWVSDHLLALDGHHDDINADADQLLLDATSTTSTTADYDLINGLVGLGVLALGRAERTGDVQGLARIVERLDARKVPRGPGVAWKTDPSVLPAFTRAKYPNGYYNLGVAHGVPGVIGFLCRALEFQDLLPQPIELLREAVHWVLSCRIEESAQSIVPPWQAAEEQPSSGRSAWCYGDAGVAACLMPALRWLPEASLADRVRNLAHRAASLPVDGSGVVDAGVCHGSSGLGLLFARLHYETGEPAFAEASRRWYQNTLERYVPETGIGGFVMWTRLPDQPSRLPTAPPTMGWAPDAEFLAGSAGVALSLLSASAPVAPKWDRLLLLS